MSPFRDHRPAAGGGQWCYRYARCAFCCRRMTDIRQEFTAIVRDSWSPAEIELLSTAARAALL